MSRLIPFAALMEDLSLPKLEGQRIGVAVSGGPDSMALLSLLNTWCKDHNVRLHALHVDHRLRPQSHDEAHQVALWAEERGIPPHILVWEHPPLASQIQEMARNARYTLMEKACRELGIQYLFLAHHRQDQLETFFMRLTHGSDIGGLGGIRPLQPRKSVTLVRPFLPISKKDILNFVSTHKIPHLMDPSNTNQTYERVRIRQFLGSFNHLKLDDLGGILASIQKLQQAEDALQTIACQWISDHVSLMREAYFVFKRWPFQALLPLMQRRVLTCLIRSLVPRPYPFKSKSVQELQSIIDSPHEGAKTLGGAYIKLNKQTITICREYASIQTLKTPFLDYSEIWDNRFYIEGSLPHASLAPLGPQGVKQLQPLNTTHIPSYVLETLPALWREGRVISQPHLKFQADEALRISLNPSILNFDFIIT